MPYCIQTDITDQLPLVKLVQLTDDDKTGSVDTETLAKSIADADAEIDGYCAIRYTAPFAPVPVMIRKLSVDIAIYNLFTRKPGVVPEERQKRYENAIRFLRDVSKGFISLGADAPAEANASNTADIAGNARIFDRGKMQGF